MSANIIHLIIKKLEQIIAVFKMVEICVGGGRGKNTVKNTQCVFPYIFRTHSVHIPYITYTFSEQKTQKHTKTQCVFPYIFRAHSVHIPYITYTFSGQKIHKNTQKRTVFLYGKCVGNIREMYGMCTECVRKMYGKTHCVFFTVFFSLPPPTQISTILKTAIIFISLQDLKYDYYVSF
jgi:hypothetical protein